MDAPIIPFPQKSDLLRTVGSHDELASRSEQIAIRDLQYLYRHAPLVAGFLGVLISSSRQMFDER